MPGAKCRANEAMMWALSASRTARRVRFRPGASSQTPYRQAASWLGESMPSCGIVRMGVRSWRGVTCTPERRPRASEQWRARTEGLRLGSWCMVSPMEAITSAMRRNRRDRCCAVAEHDRTCLLSSTTPSWHRMHCSGGRVAEPVRTKWIRSLTVGDSTLTRFCRLHAYLPRASCKPASTMCDGVLVWSSSVASRWAKPSAVNLTPRADFRGVICWSSKRRRREGPWVSSAVRTTFAGATCVDPANSTSSGGEHGGALNRETNRPSECLPEEVATFAAVSTTLCSRTPGVHRRGSDHRRPCSVHCQSTVAVPGMRWSTPLPTMVRTASHNGENLSESDARAVRGRPDLCHPCTEERESVYVEYVWSGWRTRRAWKSARKMVHASAYVELGLFPPI